MYCGMLSIAQVLQSHSESIIANALLEYSPKNLALSFNGGKDCTVLLDLVAKVWNRFPYYSGSKLKVVYVAEPDSFPELEKFILESVKRYEFIELHTFTTNLMDAFKQFSSKFEGFNFAVLLGVRSTDPYCDKLHEVQVTDNGWPRFLRISPILRWSYSHIWEYIDNNKIEYCSLYDQGYTSLGSRSRTDPNPALKSVDGSYFAARHLKNSELERCGRK